MLLFSCGFQKGGEAYRADKYGSNQVKRQGVSGIVRRDKAHVHTNIYQTYTFWMDGAPVRPPITLAFNTTSILESASLLPTFS
jgi:hypothetical protein